MRNKSISELLKSFCFQLVGHFSWKTPPWMAHLVKIIRSGSSRERLGLFFIVFVILSLSYLTIINLKAAALPRITANVTAPDATPIAEKLQPDSVQLDFQESVAPLKWIQKEIHQNVTLTPAMSGKWFWQNDKSVTFTPDQDWPADQAYSIQFMPAFFMPKNMKLHYVFATQPLGLERFELNFYQDPRDPAIKQAVATMEFNYPIDKKSLSEHVTLKWLDQDKKPLKWQLTFDKHQRIAYLHSESLLTPNQASYLALVIEKGVKPFHGKKTTHEVFQKTLLIPDASSYFKVETSQANIIRNQQDQPEQVLTIETSLGVTNTELSPAIEAYVLPNYYPATKTEPMKWNYYWHAPGEVTDDILALATPLTLEALPTDVEFATLHSYRFHAETPGFIYLKIAKGTNGLGDFKLAEAYRAIIPISPYPKEIQFLHPGALLALSSEKKLTVTTRGLPAIQFNIARVKPDAINQLVSQTGGQFNNPYFLNYHFNENDISEISTEVRELAGSHPGKLQFTALNLADYFNTSTSVADGPLGLFLLDVKGYDHDTKQTLNVGAKRLILMTDLGLLVKDNKDGSHDVFVQSITKGSPVRDVEIIILGKNGLPILTQKTDAEGHVHFVGVSDFAKEKEPVVYLARKGSDVAFIPYQPFDRQLNYSRFDVGGLVSDHSQSTPLNAYVFSDRGLYRPGETVHLGMIVKRAYAKDEVSGLPLQMMITDPRGVILQDRKIALPASGYIQIDFNTLLTSYTGDYRVNLFIVKDHRRSNLLGGTSFKIAEFLPDRLKIAAEFSKEVASKGWVSPDDIRLKVNLMNLYGAPATGQLVRAKMVLSPETVRFNTFPQYTFFDPLLDPKKPHRVFSDTLTELKTDATGNAEIPLKLDRFQPATYQLMVFAEGFEASGGRSVSTEIKTLVSPLDYLVGYRNTDDLHYIKQHESRSVNWIAINPELKQIEKNALTMQLFSVESITTLIKKPDGTFQYQSLPQSTLIKNQLLAIGEQGTEQALATDQIGDFILQIADEKGMILSQLPYSVVGASQKTIAKHAELTVKLNQTEYSPGQDIEMEITAPYTGSGLITIERDKVYAYQWFKAETSHSIQKIRIPDDFQGDGYVNIAFVRDWNSADIYTSPLSFHVAHFTVNRKEHQMNIQLSTSDRARPGQPVVIKYQSDKAGKIIIFAVDEGILQVARFHTPDPLGFFFQKRALEVDTKQIVDQILPKFMAEREFSATGGDQGKALLKQYLNPFKRKTDVPVVYWSGVIETDQTPRELVYTIPDYFNGQLRIMAVGVGSDVVGSTETRLNVKGDFVIQPNVPTFVAPGDVFDVTANVANQAESGPVNVALQAASSQFDILSTPNMTVQIDQNQSKIVRFTLRAKSSLGNAQLIFRVGVGNNHAQLSSAISIRPASAFQATLQSRQTHASEQVLSVDRALYPAHREVIAIVSSQPFSLVFGLQRYLAAFPYGCTEQVVSKSFPLLSLLKQPEMFHESVLFKNNIQQAILTLSQRQLSGGGFSYWPNVNDHENNAFASVYAMHFLTEVKESGLEVPRELFNQGIQYLKTLAEKPVDTLDQARMRAYAIYLLTQNEIVTTHYLTHLQLYLDQDKTHAWHHDVITLYLAATYQLLKSEKEAERLRRLYQSKDQAAGDMYNENIANAIYLYLIAKHFPDKIDDKQIATLVDALNQSELSTLFASFSSLALAAISEQLSTQDVSQLELTAINSAGDSNHLTLHPRLYQKIALDSDVKKLQIKNPNKQRYFFQLMQFGFDRDPVNKTISNHLEIAKEYRDLQHNTLSAVELGQEIEVHIRIRALDNQYHSDIAIQDLLPGGFEMVNDSEQHSLAFADQREDKMLFFGSIGPDVTELVYRIKAINVGEYQMPAVFAESMYQPSVQARGLFGSIQIYEKK